MWLDLGLLEVAKHLKKGSVTSSHLCSLCLKRIQSLQKLNAFITVTAEEAQEQAVESDKRRQLGKAKSLLDGIPIAVKDNYSTKGIKTTCGSRMLSNYTPPFNATMVQKLVDAGGIIIGKTNMDEFAMGSGTVDSYYGPARNPWDPGFKQHDDPSNKEKEDWAIPGGSSGGSAIAVSIGCSFGALGSDTGGSTRNPASYCGVVGLKPTYGLLSRHGLIPLTNSADVPGILTRNVDDAAFLFGLLAGHDPLDSTTVSQPFSPFSLPDDPVLYGMHIGIPREYKCDGISPEVVSLWEEIANMLQEGGAQVSEVSLPHTKYSIPCYSVLNCCEVASNFARYDGIEYGHRAKDKTSTESLYATSRCEGFNEVVRGRILAGNYFLLRQNYKKYFEHALKVRRLVSNDFKAVFQQGIDVLLTPVTRTAAPKYSKWVEKDNREQAAVEDYFTQPVNLAGLPAVSIPCKLSSEGLPLSLQLISKRFSEEQMLTVAKWIEQRVNFPAMTFKES